MTHAQLCTFVVDDLLFGVPVLQVQEVLSQQALTRVPLASSAVRGLINLRGQIVTAIDLRACLGLAAARTAAPSMNVVVHAQEGCVSLMVDAIGDVIDVTGDCFEPPPTTLPAPLRQLVEAVCKLPERLLLVLAPARALTAMQPGRMPP